MGIYHPTIDNLLIHNEYVTMPGYIASLGHLYFHARNVNTLPHLMPDIGGSSQKYGGGGVIGGGGGGGGPSTLVSRTLRVN